MDYLYFLKAGNWTRPERHIFPKNLAEPIDELAER
jgi:hypothetical protein